MAGSDPTYRPQYRLTQEEKEELAKQIPILLKEKKIRESDSPYNAPVLFSRKKSGDLRLCIDYRALNDITVKNRFPMPIIEDTQNEIGGSKVFSKLDLTSGYHQITLEEQSMPLTAFSTDHRHYEWTVMPFGLTGAPATMVKLINNVLAEYIGAFAITFLDDLLIYSQSEAEHELHVRKVLQKLREHGLIATKSKCALFLDKVSFLGYEVSAAGVLPDKEKIYVIVNWPTPKTIKEAQPFIGLAGFYRRFIANFSQIATPLHRFIDKLEDWSSDQDNAFRTFKQKLSSSPVLVTPRGGSRLW
ncbi:unnamed protein product [Ambrosiozyma monospora]|uniref:Unnamed protein product n=1 Tax=Ambrosiozyma monospora TaxID=43982 RepID=A0ACB5SY47_AMBMO|nr:unnamed protein product [Ambrosiozyma monospora]